MFFFSPFFSVQCFQAVDQRNSNARQESASMPGGGVTESTTAQITVTKRTVIQVTLMCVISLNVSYSVLHGCDTFNYVTQVCDVHATQVCDTYVTQVCNTCNVSHVICVYHCCHTYIMYITHVDSG